MDPKKKLEKLATEKGLTVVDRGNGHLQIVGGPLLVNYYPLSKKHSAYVAGTTSKKTGVTPENAVEMAFIPPPVAVTKDRRKGNYRSEKRKMIQICNKCHWCGIKLTLETATMEHVIPLYRGGLDNANNRVLACKPCNSRRGHEMPELRKQESI